VLAQHPLPIAPRETAGSLHDKLAALGARSILGVLLALQRGESLDAVQQPDAGATYAAKIDRDQTTIDWSTAAQAIDRKVRAFDPVPGAETDLAGERIKIWKGFPLAGRFGPPGGIVRADAAGIVVACGDGALMTTELQRAGGKRMSAAAFLAGHRLATEARFGSADG
jgi:methionyl-tRNA formyltransferase